MFRLLRGMFALAIWDAPRRTLVLARDRMGQKPLVYRHDRGRGRLAFASELKALLALPEDVVPRRVDPLALDQYLCYGYVPHPRTILDGVAKLPPAHFAVWHDGALAIERYWSPDWNLERERSMEEDVAELGQTLDDAVREQMIADVPLGAFLSGGIDSTIVVGLMQRASSRPVKTFAIGFPDPQVRRDALRRAGRPAPGHRAPDLHRRAEGVGDAARAGLAVRRAVRRQLGPADVVRRARDPALGDRRPDRRCRRRALRRIRPIPGPGADRAVPADPGRPAPRAGRDDGPRAAPLVEAEDPAPRAPSAVRAHQRAGRRALPRLDDDLRRGRAAVALHRRPDRPRGLGRDGRRTTPPAPTRPRSCPPPSPRRRDATASPAPWSPTS